MGGFWHLRCIYNRIDQPDMIGSFASGANVSLVAKLELKILLHLAQSIESKIMDRFWHLRCLYDRIDQPDIIGSFACGANVSLVAKIGTKDLATSCSVNRI